MAELAAATPQIHAQHVAEQRKITTLSSPEVILVVLEENFEMTECGQAELSRCVLVGVKLPRCGSEGEGHCGVHRLLLVSTESTVCARVHEAEGTRGEDKNNFAQGSERERPKTGRCVARTTSRGIYDLFQSCVHNGPTLSFCCDMFKRRSTPRMTNTVSKIWKRRVTQGASSGIWR